MKPIRTIYRSTLLLLSVFALTSCGMGNTDEESRMSMIQSVNPEPIATQDGKNQKLAEKVKKDVQALPELYDVAVIKGKEQTLVAYKVKHMQRFNMKKIEKEMKQKLEKNYPKENFIVSSDFKIFIEVIELKEKLKDPNYPRKEAEKKLNKIIELQKELT